MAYGVEPVELFRRAAAYVDRILKGAKPAELPVQAPTKFELVIILKLQRLSVSPCPRSCSRVPTSSSNEGQMSADGT